MVVISLNGNSIYFADITPFEVGTNTCSCCVRGSVNIEITRNDGVVIASYPYNEITVGSTIPGSQDEALELLSAYLNNNHT